MEELDSVRDLAEDDKFIALKSKIADIKNKVSPDTPVKKYLDGLVNKAEKLRHIKEALQDIAASDDITFANIREDLLRLQKAGEAKIAAEKDQTVKPLFGNQYAGAETNIQDVEQTAHFIRDCLAVPQIQDTLGMFFNKDFGKNWREFINGRTAVKDQHAALNEQAEQTQAHSAINLSAKSWKDVLYEDLISLFRTALTKPDNLSRWIDLNAHLSKAAQDIKGELLTIYDKEKLDFETLPLAFEYMIYSAVAREIYTRNPVISSTNGLGLEQARARIKELDQEILNLQKDELCNALNKSRPQAGNGSGRRSSWTEGALIHNEISKQRRHIPIRDLMKRAGNSIQAIKPCFLMSPLTVAQYLDPGKFTFDLVVIDEASQMRPEDALGGIARAKQIVVVGDPQQLPPTSFFQSAGKQDEEEDEDFTSEAVMDMALSSFRPSRILSRHYRSQHESLIAFSNYHFYDKSLVLFPSPIKNPDELGLRLEYVGGTYASNSNMDEVQVVVKAALDFMREYPERSLGIATMNQVQKDLIEVEMDRAFIDHPHAAKYKARWQKTLESFFVKNLESVQGDERDAIFISTVYGPDKNGTVMQRFGPINRAGGYEICEEIQGSKVVLTKELRHWEGYTPLYPHHCRTVFRSGKVYLRDFLCARNNHKLALPESADSIRVLENDLVILHEEKKRFEQKHQLSTTNICQVKIIGRVGKTKKPSIDSFDPSFKKICFGGQKYNFGDMQASIIRQLYDAAIQDEPWQNGKRLLEKAGSQSFTLSNIFKRNPMWRQIIISDERGSYRLNEDFFKSLKDHYPVTN
ncbi:MAG: DNA2/NAM7 family helicase [Rhodospirillales bacterium]|nr:DNA2/NAM7 family helicase [Rhodospirillales bacterium]